VISGWALDRAVASGTGIDALHVWAYPVGGSAPIFVGVAAYGGYRPDVGAIFGRQFDNTGFTLSGITLSPGRYDLAVFPHSTGTGRFSTPALRRVTVR
jgi:hypothetical protein